MSVTNNVIAVGGGFFTAYLSTTNSPVLGLSPGHALAGFVGAVISVLIQKPAGSRETLAITVCGTASAIYGTGVACRWIGIEKTDAAGLVAVLLGIGGIFVCRRAVDIWQDPGHLMEIIRSGKFSDLLKTTPRPVVQTVTTTHTQIVDPKTSTADVPTKG